ncbi:MAG: hypothetical protein HWN67_16375 [Candidatus Helarchaeota archaeon]|nr:hypothetical protein [Candidatus Helarchaeota archaeon]
MLNKILIVDPYQDRVFSLQTILEKEGYEVYFAFNNEEAVTRLSVDEIYLIIYRHTSEIDNLTNLLNWIKEQNRLIGVSILVIPNKESELFKLIEKFEPRINKDIFFITDLDELKEDVSLLLNSNYVKNRLLNEKIDAVSHLDEIKSEGKKLLSELRKEKREINKKRLEEMKTFKRIPKLDEEEKKENDEDFREKDSDYVNLIKSINFKIKDTINLFKYKKKFASERIEFINEKLKKIKVRKD